MVAETYSRDKLLVNVPCPPLSLAVFSWASYLTICSHLWDYCEDDVTLWLLRSVCGSKVSAQYMLANMDSCGLGSSRAGNSGSRWDGSRVLNAWTSGKFNLASPKLWLGQQTLSLRASKLDNFNRIHNTCPWMVEKNQQQLHSSMLGPWEKRRDKVAEQKEQSGIAAMNAHYDTEAELWPFTSHLHPGLLTLHPSGPHYKQLSQYFTPGYTLTNKQLDQRLWWRSRNLTSKGVGICCDTRWVNRNHRSQLEIEIWCLINWWQITKPCKSVSFLPLWNKVDSSIGR